MLNLLEKNKSFGGLQEVYEHESLTNKCMMKFAIYRPETSIDSNVLFFLSGLTCSEQNFIQKSGFQKYAYENNLTVVVPDTSPRGENIMNDDDDKLGFGAGFYLNATSEQWKTNYNMYDYITAELPSILDKNFNFDLSKLAISGHSMGGSGAIQIGLKNKDLFKSVSAFAPICSLFKSNFSVLAIKEYLNSNESMIENFDPISLVKKSIIRDDIIKIDVGLNDEFLQDLFIEEFEYACTKNNQKLDINKHHGYGHNYYFVQTFIKEHIEFHSKKFNEMIDL